MARPAVSAELEELEEEITEQVQECQYMFAMATNFSSLTSIRVRQQYRSIRDLVMAREQCRA